MDINGLHSFILENGFGENVNPKVAAKRKLITMEIEFLPNLLACTSLLVYLLSPL